MDKNKLSVQKELVYVMLFNCEHPSNKALTQDPVNSPEINGAYLHRFSWLKDEEIGELDPYLELSSRSI